jgi:uncharacterized protein (TIGR03084 family)
MPVSMRALLADLLAETRVVQDMVDDLDAAAWDLPTPALGWAIRDQITHLAYFDEAATLAAVAPDRFVAEAAELTAVGPGFSDVVAARYRALPVTDVGDWFRGARRELVSVFADLDPKARLPWYGPDMSATSSATARLMETWAHGQDVADTLGVRREPTVRLRHIAHLGVSTFGFAHRLRGRAVPADPVRVELEAPDGGRWEWGPAGAENTVSGPALDFCLVVTQRRHLTDTALRITGPVAAGWMSIAQAFAGAPGPGREPAARPEHAR